MSDSRLSLKPGTVLRRLARRDTLDRAFRAEADVAELLDVGPAEPMEGSIPADTRKDDSEPGPPILCLVCGRRFEPIELSLEELEVADYWAYRVAFERELRAENLKVSRGHFVLEQIRHWNERLAGRRVACPACRRGTISFQPGWWERF